MLRGHFKSFAIYSLITTLVASPIMAASPGDASRRAAAQAQTSRQTATATAPQQRSSGVQTALGLRPIGQKEPIQQVVGKQPSAPKSDPNRTLSLLPGLFGGSQRSATTRSGTSSAKQTSSRPQSSPTRDSIGEQAVSSKGILSGLFGSRSGSQPETAAKPIDSPPAKVDWQGIPYHQARSQPTPQSQTPIRDPRPGETRIGGPATLPTAPPATRLASPSVPKPPALAAPPTSRRTVPARVASSRIDRPETDTLSPLSSSRRSERRDVPALDASEIAAAQDVPAAKEIPAPAVARRQIGSDQTATKVAKTETKPLATKAATQPKKVDTKGSEPKSTPSADVAVNPQRKAALIGTAPEPTAPPKTIVAPQTPAANLAQSTAVPVENQSPTNVAAAPQPAITANSAAPIAASSVTQSMTPAPLPIESSVAPITDGLPAPKAVDSVTPPTFPANSVAANTQAPTPQQPPANFGQSQPSGPQFVAPQLPLPASPHFGSDGTIAGHRSGPPASAFQARTQPRAALNPANAPFGPAAGPIGSGVNPQPPTASTAPGPGQFAGQPALPRHSAMPQQAMPQQGVPTPQIAAVPYSQASPYPGAQRVAQNPYPFQQRDPYAAPPSGAPSRAPTSDPGAPYAQSHPGRAPASVAPGSTLGTPMERLRSPYPTPAPQSLAQSPALPSTVNRAANGSERYAENTAPTVPFVDRPFQAPQQPRLPNHRSTNSELPAGQTAVASELPGIRVVTHGPSNVIIRQTHEFEIRVENRGSIDATGLMVRAVVPDWAEIKGQTSSRGSVENQDLDDSARLVWSIDSLPAGTTEKMFVRIQARQSGTHKLDVDWTLIPQKSVTKIEVREPKLDLVIEGPESVVYGESQTYKVRVLNPGDGIAANVVFTLSPNSSTPQTQRIGDIPSGKEAQFEVELTAQDLGDLKIHGLASGDLGLKAQAEKTILVSSADLEAVLAGPEMQYQNTEAMYHLQITNKGTATCKNITANLALPPGVRYQDGIDIAKKRGTKLTWEIDSLPPGASRDYELNCTMVSPGKQTFEFDALGSAAGKTAVALATNVESIADLVMTIQDPAAPAPVGTEVVYEILIKNRGSRQAQGVRAIAQFSKGIEPRRIEGHSGQVLTGQVLFDPIDVIRPGEELRIRVIAEAESEGHHRFRTEIRSGETVLVAEEATQYLSKRGERVSRRSSSSGR